MTERGPVRTFAGKPARSREGSLRSGSSASRREQARYDRVRPPRERSRRDRGLIGCRGVVEGVTLGMSYGLRRLRQLGIEAGEIRLTGGGSRSPVWRHICADVFGCPVVCLRSAEGAALGAAIQALSVAQPPAMVEDLCRSFAAPEESTRVVPRGDFDYEILLLRQDTVRERLFGSPKAAASSPT